MDFANQKGVGKDDEHKSRVRPVIFIDEIHAIQPLLRDAKGSKAARQFVDWLVKISRDAKMCDVIVSSFDGFALEVLQLEDTAYSDPMVVPSFSRDDMTIVAKSFPHLTEDLLGTLNTYVAGHAEHVKKLLKHSSDDEKMRDVLVGNLRTTERDTLAKVKRISKTSCRTWWGTKDNSDHCFEEKEFQVLMNKLLETGKRTLKLLLAL